MASSIDIDALYETFCSNLPAGDRAVGRSLAFALKLAPRPDIPWSAVFKHPVTLEAPRLLAEAMPRVPSPVVQRAVLAHMLAVIEAFGTDRIADQQVEDEPELRRVLAQARTARDEALFGIGGAGAVHAAEEADRRTLDAITTERLLLAGDDAVDLATYETVSAGKQAVGLPASIALAESAGLGAAEIESLRSILMGVWLGLQFQDDVIDWEDDATRGGAWAILLARQQEPGARASRELDALRRLVLPAGVLADMLRLSFEKFQLALSGAERLGAEGLAEWLRVRAAEARGFHEHEQASPGYLRRMKQLAPWAAEVLG